MFIILFQFGVIHKWWYHFLTPPYPPVPIFRLCTAGCSIIPLKFCRCCCLYVLFIYLKSTKDLTQHLASKRYAVVRSKLPPWKMLTPFIDGPFQHFLLCFCKILRLQKLLGLTINFLYLSWHKFFIWVTSGGVLQIRLESRFLLKTSQVPIFFWFDFHWLSHAFITRRLIIFCCCLIQNERHGKLALLFTFTIIIFLFL